MTYRPCRTIAKAAVSPGRSRNGKDGRFFFWETADCPRFILNASAFSTSTAAGNARQKMLEFLGHTERKITNSSRILSARIRHGTKTDKKVEGETKKSRWPAMRATINNSRYCYKRVSFYLQKASCTRNYRPGINSRRSFCRASLTEMDISI